MAKLSEPFFEDSLWKYELVFERGDSNAIHQFFFPTKGEADKSHGDLLVQKDTVQDNATELSAFEKKRI